MNTRVALFPGQSKRFRVAPVRLGIQLPDGREGKGRLMKPSSFRLRAVSGNARLGEWETSRGVVHTPCFMPVGTRAAVKGVLPSLLRSIGAQIVLANTFHLHLRPGEETIERLGGLHEFMRYDGPMLTDSGGYQVFSLTDIRSLTEEGVAFRSPIDGAKCFLSPEKAMEIQRALGPDFAMAFDECPPADMEGQALRESMERTLRWLERCLTVRLQPHQCLLPIVQGGMDAELRHASARRALGIAPDAAGYAIGGLAVGEAKPITYRMLEHSVAELPGDRPRYMMGIGTPEDLVWAVDRGVDMFDCVLPSRNARHARVFAGGGMLNLRNSRFREDPLPILEGCDCPACSGGFSRAYLHHLQQCGEALGGTLCTLHNLRVLLRQCEEMRSAIAEGRWDDYKAEFFSVYTGVPADPTAG